MQVEWIVFEIFVNIVEVCAVFYLLCKKFSAMFRNIAPMLLFIAGSVSYLSLPLFLPFKLPVPVEIVTFALYLLYALFFRRGNFWKKIFWVSLIYALLFVISFSTVTLVSMISKMNSMDIMTEPSHIRFITMAIGKVIQIAVFYVLSTGKKKVDSSFSPPLVACFAIPFISVVSGIAIYQIILRDVEYAIPEMMIYIIAASYLSICIAVFVLYETINKEAEKYYMLLAKHNQYEFTEQHNIQVVEVYERMRKWNHEFMNHMQAVAGMIEHTDPESNNEALNYIHGLDEKIKGSYLEIATGNLVVDAIVSAKATLAEASDIKFKHDIILKGDVSVNDTDLCSILSNLLDNAIEACRKLDENRYIELEMLIFQDHLSIKTTNTSSRAYKMENGKLKTTKNGNLHGIGMGHVKSIVESYSGTFNFKPGPADFATHIMIPLSLQS
jgi:hypothetical protein